ncbi:mucin-2-like [Stegodyphus dumicola]|uniref:mucin-2-like n=1 Tax=Stegodyphus dumicola TaxID=202533 RepID=UPI0015AA60E0|nr:mucin-2-like [Stegodyphus dumicola]
MFSAVTKNENRTKHRNDGKSRGTLMQTLQENADKDKFQNVHYCFTWLDYFRVENCGKLLYDYLMSVGNRTESPELLKEVTKCFQDSLAMCSNGVIEELIQLLVLMVDGRTIFEFPETVYPTDRPTPSVPDITTESSCEAGELESWAGGIKKCTTKQSGSKTSLSSAMDILHRCVVVSESLNCRYHKFTQFQTVAINILEIIRESAKDESDSKAMKCLSKLVYKELRDCIVQFYLFFVELHKQNSPILLEREFHKVKLCLHIVLKQCSYEIIDSFLKIWGVIIGIVVPPVIPPNMVTIFTIPDGGVICETLSITPPNIIVTDEFPIGSTTRISKKPKQSSGNGGCQKFEKHSSVRHEIRDNPQATSKDRHPVRVAQLPEQVDQVTYRIDDLTRQVNASRRNRSDKKSSLMYWNCGDDGPIRRNCWARKLGPLTLTEQMNLSPFPQLQSLFAEVGTKSDKTRTQSLTPTTVEEITMTVPPETEWETEYVPSTTRIIKTPTPGIYTESMTPTTVDIETFPLPSVTVTDTEVPEITESECVPKTAQTYTEHKTPTTTEREIITATSIHDRKTFPSLPTVSDHHTPTTVTWTEEVTPTTVKYKSVPVPSDYFTDVMTQTTENEIIRVPKTTKCVVTKTMPTSATETFIPTTGTYTQHWTSSTVFTTEIPITSKSETYSVPVTTEKRTIVPSTHSVTQHKTDTSTKHFTVPNTERKVTMSYSKPRTTIPKRIPRTKHSTEHLTPTTVRTISIPVKPERITDEKTLTTVQVDTLTPTRPTISEEITLTTVTDEETISSTKYTEHVTPTTTYTMKIPLRPKIISERYNVPRTRTEVITESRKGIRMTHKPPVTEILTFTPTSKGYASRLTPTTVEYFHIPFTQHTFTMEHSRATTSKFRSRPTTKVDVETKKPTKISFTRIPVESVDFTDVMPSTTIGVIIEEPKTSTETEVATCTTTEVVHTPTRATCTDHMTPSSTQTESITMPTDNITLTIDVTTDYIEKTPPTETPYIEKKPQTTTERIYIPVEKERIKLTYVEPITKPRNRRPDEKTYTETFTPTTVSLYRVNVTETVYTDIKTPTTVNVTAEEITTTEIEETRTVPTTTEIVITPSKKVTCETMTPTVTRSQTVTLPTKPITFTMPIQTSTETNTPQKRTYSQTFTPTSSFPHKFTVTGDKWRKTFTPPGTKVETRTPEPETCEEHKTKSTTVTDNVIPTCKTVSDTETVKPPTPIVRTMPSRRTVSEYRTKSTTVTDVHTPETKTCSDIETVGSTTPIIHTPPSRRTVSEYRTKSTTVTDVHTPEIEASTSISASVKKLNESLLRTSDCGDNRNDDSYILINRKMWNPLLCNIKCDECSTNSLDIVSKGIYGYSTKLELVCKNCDKIFSSTFSSERVKRSNTFDVNTKLVEAFLKIGKGHAALEVFSMIMGIHAMDKKTFAKCLHSLSEEKGKLKGDFLQFSRNIVRNKHKKLININNDECIDITVSYDGTWQKRGQAYITVWNRYRRRCLDWVSYRLRNSVKILS